MHLVSIALRHCYGIKSLQYDFDFSTKNSYAIYAPNGVMKTSFAQTFKDLETGAQPKDRIFPDRPTECRVTDETGQVIAKDRVLVLAPYDETMGPSKKTCTLLVNADLRQEYTNLHIEIDAAKDSLLKDIKKQSRSKINLEEEISLVFTQATDRFDLALRRIEHELLSQSDLPFVDIQYDRVFSDKIVLALETNNLKDLIVDYVTRYNELLSASTFFKRGTFDYYNAEKTAQTLADNGFFKAGHAARLNANGEAREVRTKEELEEIIDHEKTSILSDPKLRSAFDKVATQLDKNADLRAFRAYLMENEAILSRLNNIALFKQDVLKSYLKANETTYLRLMECYKKAEQRKREIEGEAREQRTEWQHVIQIFNDRFFVPFELKAKNHVDLAGC